MGGLGAGGGGAGRKRGGGGGSRPPYVEALNAAAVVRNWPATQATVGTALQATAALQTSQGTPATQATKETVNQVRIRSERDSQHSHVPQHNNTTL